MAAFVGPLALQPVIDRLKAELTEFRLVAGAADLEVAQEQKAPTTPAAFVLLGVDRFGAREGSSQRITQRTAGSFAVVTAIRDYRASDRGAGNSADLTARIREVRAALYGWTHPESNGLAMALQGSGRVVLFKNATLWWSDVFSCDYFIRN